jgi:hypothetical protein
MKTKSLHDGPGPMTAQPEDDEEPLGAVLIDFYPDRAVVAVVADDTAAEGVIRARLDQWAVEHVGRLLQRRQQAPPATGGCGGRCRCREAGK